MKFNTDRIKICFLLVLFLIDIPSSVSLQIKSKSSPLIEGIDQIEKQIAEMNSHNNSLQPRFIEEDSNEIKQSSEISESVVNPENGEDVSEIYPLDAHAGTTFSHGYLLMFKEEFSAKNALANQKLYWRSKNGVNDDYWEAVFDKPTKIDQIVIKWKFIPKYFKLYYKADLKYKYTDCTDRYEKYSYITNDGKVRSKDGVSKDNTIIFHKPIIAKTLRISLAEPLNGGYFGIETIHFYQHASHIVITNSLVNKSKQLCLFVNSDMPQKGDIIEALPCDEVISNGRNNEIFIQNIDKSVMHMNSGLCIGFNPASELILTKCQKYSPPYTIVNNIDLTLSFTGYPTKCISIDTLNKQPPNFITSETTVLASSDLDPNYRKENIFKGGENCWQSIPGESEVTMQILFGRKLNDRTESKKIDIIKLEWVREPLEFSIYTWSDGQTWMLRKSYKDNKEKSIELPLLGVEAAGIMLQLKRGVEQADYFGLPTYALKSIYVSVNSKKVKFDDCNRYNTNAKTFQFEQQFYYQKSNTKMANDELNDLTLTYQVSKKMFSDLAQSMKKIPSLKEKMENFRKKIENKQTQLNTLLLSLDTFIPSELTVMKNKKFEELTVKYNYKTIQSSNENAPYGSIANPAPDCFSIKKDKKSSPNGFYYIRPECAKFALRVYCDFTSFGTAVDYFIYGNPKEDLSWMKIEDVDTIRYRCAIKGLLPIDIKNDAMISTIQSVLRKEGFNMAKPYVVPLGYDYSCKDQDRCYGTYKSLSDSNTSPIKSFFKEGDDSEESGTTMIGLGYGSGYKKFDVDKVKLAALVCSTNRFNKYSPHRNSKKISCEFNVRNNRNLFPDNAAVLVECPQHCNVKKGKVYGKGMYMEDSSICLSAIHYGIINDSDGGMFNVKVVNGPPSFDSAIRNGVTSHSYNNEQNRKGFFVTKHFPNCPIDKYGDKMSQQSSFLETENKGFKLDKLTKNLSEQMNQVGAQMSQAANGLTQGAKDAYSKGGDVNPFEMAKHMQEGAMNSINEMMNTIDNPQNPQNNQNTFDGKSIDLLGTSNNNPIETTNDLIQREGPSAAEPLPPIEPPEPEEKAESIIPQSTNSVIDNIEVIFKDGLKSVVKDIIDKVGTIGETISKYRNDLAWSESEKLSGASLRLLIHKYYTAKRNLLLKMNQAITLADNRVSRTRQLLSRLEKEYANTRKGSDFSFSPIYNYNSHSQSPSSRQYQRSQQYQTSIQSSSSSGSFGTSGSSGSAEQMALNNNYIMYYFKTKASRQWKAMSLHNHMDAIGIEIDEPSENNGMIYDSLILVKYGKWFDFQASVNIKLKEGKSGGVAFRIQDEFNFYALELKQNLLSLYLIKSGVHTLLTKFKNSSIQSNTWYKLLVICKLRNIEITVYSNSNEIASLSAINSSITAGSIGVFSSHSTFAFDSLNIKSFPCSSSKSNYLSQTSPSFQANYSSQSTSSQSNSLTNLPKIINNRASAYYEKFSSSLIHQKLNIIEPSNGINGPAMWTVMHNARNNKHIGLKQNSIVRYKKNEKTLAVYKDLWITNGEMKVSFIPYDIKGIVSFVFKYNTTDSTHYSYEIDNTVNKHRIVQYKNNNYQLLKEGNASYITNEIQEVTVRVERNLINITLYSNNDMKVLSVEDESIRTGSIGVGTSGLRCLFTKIQLMPTMSKDINHNKNNSTNCANCTNNANSTDINTNYNSNSNKKDQPSNTPSDKSSVISLPVSWKICVDSKTQFERDSYCSTLNPNYRSKCKSDFCNSCCDLNTPLSRLEVSHQCKKQCYRNTISDTSINTDYKDICLGSAKLNAIAYQKCDSNPESSIRKECKKDICKLCCSSLEKITKKPYSMSTIHQCSIECDSLF